MNGPLFCSLALPARMRAQVGVESMMHTCVMVLYSYCSSTQTKERAFGAAVAAF